MKWTGFRRVSLKSIVCDAADIRKRTKLQHVIDLAADIAAAGNEPIHPPTISAKGSRLLCGRDRLAASIVNKAKRLWVHIAECDDVEARELELRENIHRRTDDRSKLLAQMVSLKEQQIRAEDEQAETAQAGTLSHLHGASNQTVKARARKEVAKAAGITTAAVRKAEQRAEDHGTGDRSTVAEGAQAQSEQVPVLDLLGVTDDGGLAIMHLAAPEQAAIDEADKHLRLAQTALARLSHAALQQELKEQVRRVASMVRAARPAAICPWCKGLPGIQKCGPCDTFGYVPAEKAERAPRELREGPPMVAINGVFYPYEDVRDGKLPAKNGTAKHAKAPKRGGIQVETTDGVTHDLAVEMDADEAY